MSSGELPPTETPPAPEESPAAIPLAQRAVRGGMWLAAASYWAIGFGFAANIVLTRMLTPEVYGEYALATFFAMLFQLRTKVGLSYAYAQERAITGAAVGTVFTLDVLLGAGGLVIGLAASPILLALGYSWAVVAMMLVLLLLSLGESFLTVYVLTLEKELQFKPGSIISSIILPLSYLPAFWFAWTGRGSFSLISQYVAFSLLGISFFGVFIWRRMQWVTGLPRRFDWQLARRYLHYGALTGVAAFLSSMVTQSDSFVVGTRAGVTALGYYDRGFRTAQWPNLLLNTLLSRSALFTYAQVRDDTMRLRKSVSMVIWLIVSMGAPIALALAITAPDLVRLVYGDRWLPAVPILRLLVIAAMLRPIWDNAFALFVGTGRPHQAIWIGAFQLIVILGLGWPLAGLYGPIGVGVSVVIAYVAALVIAQRMTADLLQLDLMNLFIKPLATAALVAAGYWLLTRWLPLNDWSLVVRVMGKGLYAVAGYYLVSFLLQPRATLERLQYVWRLLR